MQVRSRSLSYLCAHKNERGCLHSSWDFRALHGLLYICPIQRQLGMANLWNLENNTETGMMPISMLSMQCFCTD